ncbi:amidase family protein [Methylocystis heyeri]|uniref:Amidase n=1 Tax=Methylocystis heyeri TaxID=391905 RepID=A0A6B8KFK0_9HYPH|nr:amidase family protein [Methylocystis heyeri]QGM47106.1 amidase [Methylocystis heyeri]
MMKKCHALTTPLDIAGREGGLLAGLSFVVKENIDVAGHVTTNGQPAFAATHPPAGLSAPAVERLLASGARLVGKAHMDEMAYSLFGANHHYGAPENPKAPGRLTGGSSSGSAAAVAGGLADFALGTDTAGSCRAPASFCGVYGFRPSHGAVSSEGVVPLARSLDTVGWFARDISVFERVAGVLLPDDIDGAPFGTALLPIEALADCPARELALFKSALELLAPLFRVFSSEVDTGSREENTIKQGDLDSFRFNPNRKESRVREVELPQAFSAQALGHFRNLQAYEANQSQGGWIASARPELGPGVAERFAYAATVTKDQKAQADAFRLEAKAEIEALLGEDGFFILPTTPFFAPPLDESAEELDRKRYQMFPLFITASFFGLPQISLPLAGGALPLGLSLIGRRWSDRNLLVLAQKAAALLGSE